MMPEIIAHRTGMPQNSLGGLYWCLKNGVNQIECDITFTKDKKPVVWLDSMNHLLNRKKIPISKLTLKEVLSLQRSDYPEEKILTPEDIWYFLAIHPKIRIFFDVKYYFLHDVAGQLATIPDELIELATKELITPALEIGLENQIGFITFLGGAKLLHAAKKHSTRIATNLIIMFPWTRCDEHFCYVDSVTIGQTNLNKWMWNMTPSRRIQNMVKDLKEQGVKVHAGFANTESDIRRFLKYGAEGLWTDNIPLVKKILKGNS